MSKRGQVTAFIVVGILLVALVGGYLFVQESLGKGKDMAEREGMLSSAQVRVFVQSCLQETLTGGLMLLAEQGGYAVLPELSSEGAHRNAPFYFHTGDMHVPTLEQIQARLGEYIATQLRFCTKNFEGFHVPITFEAPTVTTTIGEKSVSATMQFPISIQEDQETVTLSEFNANLLSPFMQLYDASKELAELVPQYSGTCLDCVRDVAVDNNVRVNVVKFTEDTFFYVIRDPNEKLLYRFAVKYVLPEEDPVIEFPVREEQ